MQFQIGDQVEHEVLGAGTVKAITGGAFGQVVRELLVDWHDEENLESWAPDRVLHPVGTFEPRTFAPPPEDHAWCGRCFALIPLGFEYCDRCAMLRGDW